MIRVELNESLLDQVVEQIKNQDDLAGLGHQLIKAAVKGVMAVELEEHPGYAKHSTDGHNTGNSRNGFSKKTIKGDFSELKINTPRERNGENGENGEFEPRLITKGSTRINKLDQQTLSLYSRGMTTRDIADTLEEMCGADVSPALIAKVTDAVPDEVSTCPARRAKWSPAISRE